MISKIKIILIVFIIFFVKITHAQTQTFSPSEMPIYNENHPKPNIMLMIDQAKIGKDQKITDLSPEEKEIFGKYLNNTSSVSKIDAIAAIYQKIIDDYGQHAHFGLAKVPNMSVTGYLRSDTYKNDNAKENKDLSVIVFPILANLGNGKTSKGKDAKYFSGNQYEYSPKETAHHESIKTYLKNFSTNSILSEYSSNRAWLYSISEVFKYFWGSGYALDDRRLFRNGSSGGIVDYIRAEDKLNDIIDEKRIVYKTFGDKGSVSQDPIQYVCQKNLIVYSPVGKSKNYSDYDRYQTGEGYYDAPADIPMTYEYHVKSGQNSASSYVDFDLNYSAIFNKDLMSPTSNYVKYASDPSWGHPLIWESVIKNNSWITTTADALVEYFYGDGEKGGTQIPSLAVRKIDMLKEPTDLHGNQWKHWRSLKMGPSNSWTSTWGDKRGYTNKIYDPAYIGFSIISTGDNNGIKSVDNVFPLTQVASSYKDGDELAKFISAYNYSIDHRVDGEISSLFNKEASYWKGSDSDGGYVQPDAARALVRNTFNNVYSMTNDNITLTNLYNKINDDVRKKIFNFKNNGRFIYDQHMSASTSPSVYHITTTPYLWTSEISNINNLTPDLNGIIKDAKGMAYRTEYNYTKEPSFSTHYSIKPNQGEFFTSNNGHKDISGFPSGDIGDWLKGRMDLDSKKYRFRDTPLGAIDNSSIVYTAKDHIYINLDKVGNRQRYIDKMYLKNKNFENNLIIAGSNDGLLNFIIGFRNSKGKELQRRASYFVPFFTDALSEITAPLYKDNKENFQPKLRVDGKINLFDTFIEDGTFKTIGIAGMGAGYKGLVGFELFAIDINKNISNEIKPLFEISSNTDGFKNLGYTYSEFAFYNDHQDRAIAIFGNGPGSLENKSVLYVINAISGDLLHEIDFTDLGGSGGAFSPTLVISKQGNSQKLDALYVGDYSGKLFKVDFSTENNPKATLLFDAGEGRPIVNRPLLKKNLADASMWVAFSTGMLANEAQRLDNTIQYVISLRDKNENKIINIDNLRELSIDWENEFRVGNGSSRYQYSYQQSDSTSGYSRKGLRYSGVIQNSGTIQDDEAGWYLPLKVDKKITDFYTQDANYYRPTSTKILHPLVFGQGGNNRDGSTLIYTTETILAGDKDNLCTPDIVLTTYGHMDIFDGTPNGIPNYAAGGKRVDATKKWTTHGLNPTLKIAPLQTLDGINADNQLGNMNSGINLKLTPKEREILDDVFGKVTTDRKKAYLTAATDYINKLLTMDNQPSLGNYYNSIDIRYKLEDYSKDIYQAQFSDSSAIGGRIYPRFIGNTDKTLNTDLNYKFYDYGGTRWANNVNDHIIGSFSLPAYRIPASGPFGMYGNSYNILIYRGEYLSEPPPVTRSARRLSIRKIF